MKNFVQYIDESYAVKVKELTPLEGIFSISGIDREFLPIAIFIENKRVVGVDLTNVDNLFCLSLINDAGDCDLNTIPPNHFFSAFEEIYLQIPLSDGTVTIANPEDIKTTPLLFVKEYKLPQLRHDNRFGSQAGYIFDPRIYELMNIGTLQAQDKFYIYKHHAYKNPDTMYEWKNGDYVNTGDLYQNVDATQLYLNGSILQFGDFFVKINKLSGNYPYGFEFFIFMNVRTNEFWPYIRYTNAQSQIVKAEFDLSTLTAVAGGFKIKNILHNVEITISTIYG